MHHPCHWLQYRGGALASASLALLGLLLAAGRPATRAQTSQSADAPEMSSHDAPPVTQLRIQHNEVVVRVVVRDSHGNFVSNLGAKDFRIFDNGKPQVITHFEVEQAQPGAAGPRSAEPGSTVQPSAGAGGAPPVITLPNRFLALYFDDIHLEQGDLMVVRDAAASYLSSTFRPGDRAAIFTSSGQNQVDFTDDRQKLHDDLLALRPRSLYRSTGTECPDISPYQAYKMVEEHNEYAIQIADEEAFECQCSQTDDPQAQQECQAQASRQADLQAIRSLENGLNETTYALRGLQLVCRRMARLPGQRSIVLVSPGFLTRSKEQDVDEIVDNALRENIVISSLDARGLYVEQPMGDASRRTIAPIRIAYLTGWKSQFRIEEMHRNADVLEQVADDTGGRYFHDNNDLREGFRETGSFPQTFFMLAFAPQNLKLNGRLHTLQVKLTDGFPHYNLEFRRGYFAPDKAEDAATVAREELAQMVYSQEEVRTIPIAIRTQFFKADAGDAKLSVLTHIDIAGARFRKAGDRNLDHMVLMTAVFDRSGNYVTGQQKTIDFRLFDATLARLLRSGLNVKSTVPVKPGTYLVREVVDDSGSDQISALNSTVEIPE